MLFSFFFKIKLSGRLAWGKWNFISVHVMLDCIIDFYGEQRVCTVLHLSTLRCTYLVDFLHWKCRRRTILNIWSKWWSYITSQNTKQSRLPGKNWTHQNTVKMRTSHSVTILKNVAKILEALTWCMFQSLGYVQKRKGIVTCRGTWKLSLPIQVSSTYFNFCLLFQGTGV